MARKHWQSQWHAAEHWRSQWDAANRGAFSLVEATVALAIMVVAASAVLVALESEIQLTGHVEKRTIAQGLARQLMDEVLGGRYMSLDTTPYQTAFSPSTWELQTGTRERYDDIDDYAGWVTEPPVDEYNIPLGEENGNGGRRNAKFRAPAGYLDRWRQEITVSYVNADDWTQSLSGGQTSDYRAVQVRILYDDPQRGLIELANIRRVVPYVPAVTTEEN